ncbi:MAG: discoidin domain-containing protein [Muribaculaceae bacterium]|nr:discoidin domain-containing protein [Muribaculaceae bacterium]
MKKILSLLAMLLVAATAWSLPFEPTTDPSLSTTKWYHITVDGQYLFYNSSEFNNDASSTPSEDDYYLWCFVGTESTGYKIYNRGSQGYMRYVFNSNGTGDEANLNYVELDSEDHFYIYYMDGPTKLYLAYNSTNCYIYGSSAEFATCRALDPNGTPLPTIPGDLNGDGQVDISDVNAVINMMLGKTSQTEAGDVTGDGNVDISDVNAVINIMLGKTTPVTPPEVDPTAQTLTATGYNTPHNTLDATGDEGYAKLVDGDRNTKWCVANPTGAWETIWIDLKSNVAFKPTSYILTTGNDTQIYYRRNPKNWKIYGRNSDSETWTELVHVTDGGGLAATNTTDYSFQFNGITKAYQYYRFEVLEVVGADQFESNYYAFQLAELTLVGVPQ